MRTEEEIKDKIDELESEKDDLENELEETLEDEGVDEDSEKGEELTLENEDKKKIVEKQIDILEWVLGE
ncbi:MAG: hypothetical protein ABIH38_03385 [Patescibacteria group bacterium]